MRNPGGISTGASGQQKQRQLDRPQNALSGPRLSTPSGYRRFGVGPATVPDDLLVAHLLRKEQERAAIARDVAASAIVDLGRFRDLGGPA
jgi:hypothetical protein